MIETIIQSKPLKNQGKIMQLYRNINIALSDNSISSIFHKYSFYNDNMVKSNDFQ